MMAEATSFICLNPRKAKKAAITTALSALGPIRFVSVPPMRRRDYPETQARVSTAMETAKRQHHQTNLTRAKRQLLRLQYNGARAFFERQNDPVVVAWNGLNGTRRIFMDAAADAGKRRLYFELSPFKDRITVDPCGVNFANGLPRNAAAYKAWAAANAATEDWRTVGATITARAPEHLKETSASTKPLSDPFIFVPLQVPGDSQLRLFGGAFRTVEATIKATIEAAKSLPSGWHLRIKEHPTAPERFDRLIAEIGHDKVVLDNETDTFAQVAASRAIVTVNSSVGLEAMFFDKPVVALGDCFWAIPGIADHMPDLATLKSALTAPTKLTFDTASRSAFLSFLIDHYYPDLSQTTPTGELKAREVAKIAARLGGPDEFGFWDSGQGRPA